MKLTAESAFLFRDRPVTVPSPYRHHTVPMRSKSSNVLNRPLALFFLRTLKDGLGRLRTLKDVGRFRTHRDGTATGW